MSDPARPLKYKSHFLSSPVLLAALFVAHWRCFSVLPFGFLLVVFFSFRRHRRSARAWLASSLPTRRRRFLNGFGDGPTHRSRWNYSGCRLCSCVQVVQRRPGGGLSRVGESLESKNVGNRHRIGLVHALPLQMLVRARSCRSTSRGQRNDRRLLLLHEVHEGRECRLLLHRRHCSRRLGANRGGRKISGFRRLRGAETGCSCPTPRRRASGARTSR